MTISESHLGGVASPTLVRDHRGATRIAIAIAMTAVLSAGACGSAEHTDRAVDSPEATTGTTDAGGADHPSGVEVPASCTEHDTDLPASVDEVHHLDVGGTSRRFHEHRPASSGRDPAPVLIQLHGYLSGAEGQLLMSDLAPVADDHGFVLLTPQGNGPNPYWNAVPHPELPDDLAFLEALIDDAVERLCVDPGRVYLVGMSNGAFLTSLAACHLSDRIAGVAAVAGLLSPEGCSPSRPVPVLAIHGSIDGFVPAEGSRGPALDDLPWDAESTRAFDGLSWAPVGETAAAWAARNGCDPTPTRQVMSPSVVSIAYHGCRDDADVVLVEVDGGGHTWPGSAFSAASEPILGPTTTEIDANELIWDFLGKDRTARRP